MFEHKNRAEDSLQASVNEFMQNEVFGAFAKAVGFFCNFVT
jgi:hypothetical protein